MGALQDDEGTVHLGVISGMIADEGIIISARAISGFKGYDVGRPDFEIETDNMMN